MILHAGRLTAGSDLQVWGPGSQRPRSASGRSMISSSSPAAADPNPTERHPYVTCTVRGLLLRTTLRWQPRGDLAPLGERSFERTSPRPPPGWDAPRLSIPPASDDSLGPNSSCF